MMTIDFRAPRMVLGVGALLFAAACSDTPPTLSPGTQTDVVASVKAAAVPLNGAAGQYDPLLAMLNGRRFVLLGEATHGTHEFYAERAAISRRLIAEQQFAAVIVEGEWEDAWRVNRYVRGVGTDASAPAALSGFDQFPLWMWRNQEVAGFVDWLRAHNAARAPEQRAGFYGMDVYGLMESLREVPEILEAVDPAAAAQARTRYACFAPYSSPEGYGSAMAGASGETCEDEAEAQFGELHARWSAAPADERLFNAMQNARVVMGAELYFRQAYRGGGGWAARDRHMAETVADLSTHLQARGMSGKVLVWAHNSHVGDGRAASMGAEMSVTLGRLMRERVGAQAGLVGFTTHGGSVIAAEDWGLPGEERSVRPALAGSWELAFHETGIPRFLLLGESPAAAQLGERQLLERAIGVSYHPQTERQSHYFASGMAERFDAVIHIDQTTALAPLAR